MHSKRRWRVGILTFLCLFVILAPPASASGRREVRVGFFAFDGYHMEDEYGERSGYGYDYLQYMAGYGSFNYQYVGYDRSWGEMQDMLERGQIDLLTSAQKTEERMDRFDFSEQSIGTSAAILTVKAGDNRYMTNDYKKLNGIRVGLLERNSRNESFARFAGENGFRYVPVFYASTDEMLEALWEGRDIDAAVTSNLRKTDREWVVATFAPSPFYIMVRKGDRALLEQIDEAIRQVELYHPTLKSDLFNRYYSADTGDDIAYTAQEREYIEKRRAEGTPIRLISNPDRTPLSYFENGEPKGMIPEIAAEVMKRTGIPYEWVKEDKRQEYIRAVRDRAQEIRADSSYDFNEAERGGYMLTQPYLDAAMSYVTLKNHIGDSRTVAAVRGSDIAEHYVKRHYEDQDITYYDTVSEALRAVQTGKQDGFFCYTYTAQQAMYYDERNLLKEVLIPEYSTQFSMAVSGNEDPLLYSIINKAVMSLSQKEVNQIVLEQAVSPLRSLTLLGYLYARPLAVVLLLAGCAAVLLLTLYAFYKRKNEKLELEKTEEFERFITYVCRANDGVYEWNQEEERCFSYHIEHGRVIRRWMTPLTREAFLRKVHPDDREQIQEIFLQDKVREMLVSGGEIYYECRVSRRHSGYVWNSFSIQGMDPDPDRLGSYMVFVKNIDEIKREEERKTQALKDALSSALRAGEAKSLFTSRMSHEIRTPLNAIIGYLRLAEGAQADEARVKECLDKAGLAAGHLLNIVNDVLDISAIESGKMKIACEPFELKKVIEQAGEMFRKQAEEKQIEFTVSASSLPKGNVKGDPFRISQVLINLLSNAVKFTPKGGRVSLTAVQKTVIGRQSHVQIQVKDNGIGMTQEYKERLFMPFEQQDADTARQFGGTGLGLSITKNLVSMMNGTISAESREGQGTVFTVSLSFEIGEDVGQGGEAASKSEGGKEAADGDLSALSGLRVLVAEDNEMNMEIVTALLNGVGVQTDEADNGAQAVELFVNSGRDAYQAILMDIQMPVMDGYQAAGAIRASGHPRAGAVPIIALSADALEEDVNRALGAGMNDHVAKPIDFAQLCGVLKKYTAFPAGGADGKEE